MELIRLMENNEPELTINQNRYRIFRTCLKPWLDLKIKHHAFEMVCKTTPLVSYIEFIEQEGISSTSFFDSLIDDKYGLHVRKAFFRTENWLLGGQVDIVRTNDDDIDDSGEIAFDSTSLGCLQMSPAVDVATFVETRNVGLSNSITKFLKRFLLS